jgi:hypothetical protein
VETQQGAGSNPFRVQGRYSILQPMVEKNLLGMPHVSECSKGLGINDIRE